MGKNKSNKEKKKNPIFIKAGVRKPKSRTKAVNTKSIATTKFMTKHQINKADKFFSDIQQTILKGNKDPIKQSTQKMEDKKPDGPGVDETMDQLSQLSHASSSHNSYDVETETCSHL